MHYLKIIKLKIKNLIRWFLATWPRRLLAAFLIVLFIATPLSFLLTRKTASAAWWNDSWMYRKKIEVTNSNGADLINQRVKITFPTDTLYAAGKIQGTCADIRVTDINGKLLDHWVTNCGTNSTYVYAKLNSLPKSGASLYIYYGNPQAANIQKTLGTIDNPGTSCKMMKDQGSVTANGIYYIVPGGNDADKIQVYCELSTLAADWTLVLQNSAYVTPPKPNWSDAVNSVNLTGTLSPNLDGFDLLLGLKHWNYIGSTAMVQIGSSPSDITKRATYSSISLNAGNNYLLTLGTETLYLGAGTPGIKSSSSGNHQFSTYDSDHDTHASSCSSNYSNTAWWYGSCWSGSFWGGGDVDGYQNKPYWTGSSSDYNNYGAIYVGGADTMKNNSLGALGDEEKSRGPVAYWSFNDGQGTTAQDATANNSDGTLTNMSAAASPNSGWQTKGNCVSEKCLAFDGTNDYVDFSNVPALENTFSVSLWVKANNFNLSYNPLLARDGNTTGNMSLRFDSTGHIEFRQYGGDEIRTAEGFSANTWMHIVAISDNLNGSIYVNGQLKQTGTFSASFNDTGNMRAGIYSYSSGYYFNGLIDEVKVYNYVRSEAQIKMDYSTGVAGVGAGNDTGVTIGSHSFDKWMSEGLVGHWKIDSESYNPTTKVVVDATVYENNGTNHKGTLAKDRFNQDNEAMKFSVNGESLLINYRTWKDGQTGSVTGFDQNGSTGENFRVLDRDPWGQKVPVWEARTDVDSNADGGWNSTSFAVDQTKMYRFSVWIRRTVLGNGSYYLGTRGNNAGGSNFGVLNRSDGTVNTNPYFRSASGNDIFSTDSWFLLVGHVWPAGSGTGSVYTDTGLYTASGTKIATPSDFVWQDGTASSFHRSYLYYSTDTATRQQWVYPRVDIIDGTQPSIADLLSGRDKYGDDIEVNMDEEKKSFSFWYDKDSDGSWEHIVNSDGTFYVNGTPATPTQYPLYVSGNEIYAGRTTSSDFVSGSVDDLRVYNRALSAVEVGKLYTGPPQRSSQDSLLGYWKFDEGHDGTANNSGDMSDFNGTLAGTTLPTWTNDGKFDKALSFSGGYVQTPAKTLDSTFTFSGWFQPNSFGDWAAIVTNLKHGAPSSGINIVPLNGSIKVCYGNGVDGYTHYTVSAPEVVAGQWSYAAVSYDGVNVNLYVNGVLKNTRTATVAQSSQSVRMGIWASSYSNYFFNGKIDEVKVYNYALSENEIALDMNQGKSQIFGSAGTDTSGNSSNSSDRSYCPPGDTTATCGPVAEWKLDERVNNDAKDTSGNANLGTLVGGPVWTAGKIGSALNFNGSGKRLTIANPVGQAGYTTVSLWYKRSESDSSSNWRTLVGDKTANIHHLISNSTTRNLGVWDGSFKDFGYNPPDDGKWHHYEVIYNSGVDAALYVDGVYKNQIATTLNLTTNPIGSIGNWNSGNYWSGYIDQIKIYNYDRTPAQIAWDYNRGAPVGWWRMDECQGTTINDASGNGNNGTLTLGSNAPTSAGTCANNANTAWYNGRNGKINSSLSFDGSDDYVSVPDSSLWDFGTSDFTVTYWFKTSSSSRMHALNFGSSSSSNNISFNFNDSGYGVWVYWMSSGSPHIWTTDTYRDGNWHFMAFKRNGTTFSLYIDGKLIGQTTDSSNIQVTGLTIGGGPSGWVLWNGSLDDVRVYNYGLTKDQIDQVQNNGAINFGN